MYSQNKITHKNSNVTITKIKCISGNIKIEVADLLDLSYITGSLHITYHYVFIDRANRDTPFF